MLGWSILVTLSWKIGVGWGVDLSGYVDCSIIFSLKFSSHFVH
jgi:hypothetical protein